MIIGIVPDLRAFTGGIYQYGLTMLQALYESGESMNGDDFVVFAYKRHPAVELFQGPHWSVRPLDPPSLKGQMVNCLRKWLGEEHLRQIQTWIRRLQVKRGYLNPDEIRLRPDRGRWFNRSGVEMMLYPSPTTLSFETGIPYVMAIHDLQHRLQPEFPEVSAQGEWERREYVFRNGARYATLLLADSEVGKDDILNIYGPYGVTEDRVKVLPYLPSCRGSGQVPAGEVERVLRTYHLPEGYLFYPAQFWPHKNHSRIVQALGLLKQNHGLRVPVVFCGSSIDDFQKRTFHEVQTLSHDLSLEDQVSFLGYVPDEDMAGLYAGALALVMPTFFGPTNIPVLEAWSFGCPVLTSDIRGIREQMGDAALLVNPQSVEAMALGIYRLWTDGNLRRTLADRGRVRLSNYTAEDYRCRLLEIMEEAKARIRLRRSEDVEGSKEGGRAQ